MSVTAQSYWSELRPHIRIEVYGRDGGPTKPRHRIEVTPPSEGDADRWMAFEMPCVECGRAVHPIRGRAPANNKRGPRRHLYFAPCCPLSVNIGCSRGKAAHLEYERVRKAVDDVKREGD